MEKRPDSDLDGVYHDAARALRDAGAVIAITGAGASVESGIPDFRGSGGLWEKYPPEEYATIDAFLRDPDKVWGLWHELGLMFQKTKPNPGHYALAELEKLGKLQRIITQNIDNLHKDAGNTNVIEYHGNANYMRCLGCGEQTPLDLASPYTCAPRCVLCGELMKPDIVMFGEMIPEAALAESQALSEACDAAIIVGTSATVFPAAGIACNAKRCGAYIIECNIEATDYTESITDAFLQGPAGETLPRLVEVLQG